MYSHPELRNADPARVVPALLQKRSPETRAEDASAVQKILLPVDADGAFRAGLDHVIAQSRALPTRVYLVNVQPSLHARHSTRAMRARWSSEHYRALAELQWAKGALTAQGIDAQTEVVFGEPVDEIVRFAAAHDCHKIVMTQRPRTWWRWLFEPSVSQQVMKSSPLPVTMVRPSPVEPTKESFRPSGLKDVVRTHMREA